VNYIIREEEILRAFYHAPERGILTKAFENGRWGAEETVVQGARDNYTLTVHGGKTRLYVLCQDERGDVVLATMSREGAWEQRSVLKNQAEKAHRILMHPMITQNGMSLLYNIPAQEDGGQFLVLQSLDEKGQWSRASRIDKFYPMGEFLYEVQHVSDEHVLAFYQTRTTELRFGYREATPWETGPYRPAHLCESGFTDVSCLTAENGVHFLCVVSGMFASQLLYIRKEDVFSAPVVLCEGQRIEDCALSIVRGSVRAAFLINGQPYSCVSEDGGNTFSRPARYRAKFCLGVKKAQFLSLPRQSESALFLRQVYVDADRPWDVQMIPDLYEDFYPLPKPQKPEEAEEPPERAPESAAPPVYLYEGETLGSELEIARMRLRKKENQISRLGGMLRENGGKNKS